jgi:hypothetical protein
MVGAQVYLPIGPNSPAQGSWCLEVVIGKNLQQTEINVVCFLPTGALDLNNTDKYDLENANSILNQTGLINIGGAYTTGLWELINWIFVSKYWLTLYDAGQLSSVTYQITHNALLNFSNPFISDATYNIFVNHTLFQKYSSHLAERIFPNLVGNVVGLNTVEFLPLDDINRLHPVNTSIFRTYTCTKRQRKGWFSLLISVFAADYALVGGAYSIFIFIVGTIQRRTNSSESYHGGIDIRKSVSPSESEFRRRATAQ